MSTSAKTERKNAHGVQLLKAVVIRGPGWQQAFTSLIDGYRPYLFRRCRGQLRNAADAEDVLQETFINVYRFAHRFEGRASLKTWLTRIADNQCYTFLRKLPEHMLALIEVHEAAQAARGIEADEQRRWLKSWPGCPQRQERFFLLCIGWICRWTRLRKRWESASVPQRCDCIAHISSARKRSIRNSLWPTEGCETFARRSHRPWSVFE